MNIKSKLEDVVRLYSGLRQVGHTTAVLEGAKNTNAIVITHDSGMKEYIGGLTGGKTECRSINNLGSLIGIRSPIVFDNAAILELAMASLHRINQLESELSRAREKKSMWTN